MPLGTDFEDAILAMSQVSRSGRCPGVGSVLAREGC
jgi:hypothetical protein